MTIKYKVLVWTDPEIIEIETDEPAKNPIERGVIVDEAKDEYVTNFYRNYHTIIISSEGETV